MEPIYLANPMAKTCTCHIFLFFEKDKFAGNVPKTPTNSSYTLTSVISSTLIKAFVLA